MALPGNPPATTTPTAFKTWAQAVADTAADHETRVDAIETTPSTPAASAVSFTPTGTVAATNVQAAIAEVASEAGSASTVSFTPTGTIAATDVQAAIAEVASEAAVSSAVFEQAQTVNAQTGTTYTLVASDAGKLVTLSNASAVTLTVPQDSAATWTVGVYCDLYALGAGQVTVVAGTGATLRVSGLTAKSRAQYARLGLQKVSANTWSLFGDLAAS